MAVSISRALCRELQADIAIAAVVTRKIFDGGVAPRTAGVPLITIQIIDTDQARSQDGTSGLEFARVQINAYQTSAELAKDLADLIRDSLDGNIGTAIGLTPHNVADVRSFILVEESQDSTLPIGGADIPDYVRRLEYECWYVPA